MLIAALIAIASIWLAGKNRHISSIFRSLLSRLPVIGTLIRQISVARVCLALGTALKSGVPFLEAVSLAREAAYLSEVEGAMDRVYRDLSHGMPISESLSRQRIFPHVVRNLVGAGEQTGGIDAMLFKAYEYMMSDINYRVRGLASLAGPLATIIVGGIVLLIAVQFLGGYFNMIFQAVGN